jgi:hypothetical protein
MLSDKFRQSGLFEAGGVGYANPLCWISNPGSLFGKTVEVKMGCSYPSHQRTRIQNISIIPSGHSIADALAQEFNIGIGLVCNHSDNGEYYPCPKSRSDVLIRDRANRE